MQCNLKLGMRDNEIYDEVKGKISGENTAQVMDFLKPSNADVGEKPNPLHEIIKIGNGYALIMKYKNLFDDGGLYLTGINDEKRYFIHKLENEMKERAMKEELGDIVAFLNKTDDGFIRIQGDLLLKMESREFVKNEKIVRVTWKMRSEYKIPLLSRSIVEYFTYKGTSYRLLCFGKCLVFGNHLLSVEKHGGIYVPSDVGYPDHMLITGKFKLFHMEHDTVLVKLSKSKICRITSQSLTDKQIYQTGIQELPQRSRSWE